MTVKSVVPPTIYIGPFIVLAPERVSVPVPFLTKFPFVLLLLMMPENSVFELFCPAMSWLPLSAILPPPLMEPTVSPVARLSVPLVIVTTLVSPMAEPPLTDSTPPSTVVAPV